MIYEEPMDFNALPFSCPFGATNQSKRVHTRANAITSNPLKTQVELRLDAKISMTVQRQAKWPSQGSGPGGRWFESTRPDQSFQ